MAYTYLIGWKKQDRWYYGVRKNDNGNPEQDLWVRYFTSSKKVKRFREENGEPDVVRIHKVFQKYEDARQIEARFLKRVLKTTSERWLNLHIPGKKFHNREQHTEEAKKKIGLKTKTRWQNVEYKDSMRRKLSGKFPSEEVKRKISESLKIVASERPKEKQPLLLENRSEEFESKRQAGIDNFWKSPSADIFRKNVSKFHSGKIVSEETKEKLRISRKKIRALMTCPHCGIQSRSGVIKRWHFDNCKQK